MLYKLFAAIGVKHEIHLLKTLSKVEFGVSIFCRKLAKDAKDAKHDNCPNLASLLEKQAREEHKHGKMLASLAEGSDRIPVIDNGLFLKLSFDGSEPVRQSDHQKGKVLYWESTIYPGQKVTALFENLDGLSKRYLSLRILFKGQSASHYDWCDRLAFMHLLEIETQKFYKVLADSKCSEPLRAIALKIVEDEKGHSAYLKDLLSHFPGADLEKWRDRLFWAKLGLIFDLLWLLTTAT